MFFMRIDTFKKIIFNMKRAIGVFWGRVKMCGVCEYVF